MKRAIRLAVLACCLTASLQATAKIEHLLPTPKSVVAGDGQPVVLSGTVRFATDPGARLAETFRLLLGVTPSSSTAAPLISIVYVDSIAGAYNYPLAGYPDEAYRLAVGDGTIAIEAVTELGAIHAVQTLSQMAEGWDDGAQRLEACVVTDWPAFKLRGYMLDIGRSHIAFDELKRQLMHFARFKVNTFHWHLTENQAWRFEVNRYPQLTDSATMTRSAGKYYTQEQCRELDELAYNLGIAVIPEIDMPGHSAAFERAMGHSMQTDEGVAELLGILTEVDSVFQHALYIHIGADEKAITYPGFLAIITGHIHSLGQRVVVWNPISGINITAATGADMTQMWSAAGHAVSGLPNIDCRYNYINHFDVFADLVGIYRSNIYYADRGSYDIAGTISAVWTDRYVTTDSGIMAQNNVYANVLASAERAWMGGGSQYIEQGGTTLPGSGPEYDAFADWERRFLFHKAHSLAAEPIPYVRQTDVRWLVTDAFPNGGNPHRTLPPDTLGPQQSYTMGSHTYATHTVTGAGIYLRHTWGTLVPGFYDDPKLNTTAYAWTYVYSPVDQQVGALVEFQNYSRSEKDVTPANGQWDKRGSHLWVNDEEITAPDWDNAGLTPTSEDPLGNENLTARPPVAIQLRQGWNKVFLKLPYVNTPGVRLNKWMFTFVLTDPTGRNALDGIQYSPTQQLGITGVGDARKPRIATDDGAIVVYGADGLQVSLFDTTGRQLVTVRAASDPLRLDVPATGAYLVAVGDSAPRKVAVVR